MNKAITDGILFMPPAFADGLSVWSSGDGTPGSDTYAGAPNAAIVTADPDFGSCLELQKTQSVQKLRFMGETPLLPGCYLQIRARVKAMSGALPSVRIAGWAGAGGGAHVGGVVEVGPTVVLASYGEVVEIAAIVGPGARGGVDMAWGTRAIYGHFGLDLTGQNGGAVRIDAIAIEDVTGIFLRDMIGRVDVRDFGAAGDGSTDDTAAFLAADAAAQGRTLFVPRGDYFLADSVTIEAPVVFEGTVSMPVDKMLLLTRSFDLPTYADAFGNEELAFRKAFQALLNNVDHESLDLGGRKITVTGPIDMAAAVPNKASYATRRVIRNGQFVAAESPAWETEVVTSRASYGSGDARRLTNVENVANVPVGALVTGNGVGREVYVQARNIGAGEITLSAPLYGAAASQVYTFHGFRYLLDFSGFERLNQLSISDVEFQCGGICSGIRLAPAGQTFSLRDCFISRPMDRGLSSIGAGCQGMLIDRCQFLSAEEPLDVEYRKTIALNANANDVKLRHNRATKFKHFAVLGGTDSIVTGNHFFQGDGVTNGVRTAGLIMIGTYKGATINGNYVDNCSIEWTNEHDRDPAFTTGFSFSAMSITGNIFLTSAAAPWFSQIVVKPYGAGHFLNGMTVSGNVFRSLSGRIQRGERVDDTFAGLNFARTRDVVFADNTYHNVEKRTASPLRLRHNQGTAAAQWTVDTGGELPFGGRARAVDAVVAIGELRNDQGAARFLAPHAGLEKGAGQERITLAWGEAVRGEVSVVVRVDL